MDFAAIMATAVPVPTAVPKSSLSGTLTTLIRGELQPYATVAGVTSKVDDAVKPLKPELVSLTVDGPIDIQGHPSGPPTKRVVTMKLKYVGKRVDGISVTVKDKHGNAFGDSGSLIYTPENDNHISGPITDITAYASDLDKLDALADPDYERIWSIPVTFTANSNDTTLVPWVPLAVGDILGTVEVYSHNNMGMSPVKASVSNKVVVEFTGL